VESGFSRILQHSTGASWNWRRPVDGLLAVLLAPACLACNAPLPSPSAGPVCSECWLSISPLSPPLCDRCGEPIAVFARPQSPEPRANLCPRCLHQPSPITVGRSAGAYEGALRAILHALKYEGRRGLAKPLAALMRDRGSEVLTGADFVVPVPLHWRRQLARGFNQAEEIASWLGPPLYRVLGRRRATRPQFGLRPGARQRNVDGAFAPRRRSRRWSNAAAVVEDACVVVVDDLATTGATLRECGGVLRRLGAREVRTLTAARALSPPR
jgi:ComF family protein